MEVIFRQLFTYSSQKKNYVTSKKLLGYRDPLRGQECPVGIALDIMLLGHTVGAGSIPGAHTAFL